MNESQFTNAAHQIQYPSKIVDNTNGQKHMNEHR